MHKKKLTEIGEWEREWRRCKKMKGRKIEEMGVSSRGMYMRNIADITPKW